MGFFTWIKGLQQPQEHTIRVNCQTMPLAKWEAMRRHGGYQPCPHGGTPNPPPSDFDDHLDREIARRRGSNPPAPGNKPAAPAAPPEQPFTAQLIRYWAWENEQVRIAFSEGAVQQGNGNGGPVTPKPPIKPQPTGGRLIYTDRDPGPVNRPVPSRLPDDLADLPELTAQHLDGAAAAPAPAEMPSDELMERWKRAAIAEHAKGGEPTWRTAALLAFAEGRQQAQSLQIPPPGADPVATDEELAYVWFPPRTYDDARRAIYDRGRADERTAILRALGVEP
jgi:hypothetical protein